MKGIGAMSKTIRGMIPQLLMLALAFGAGARSMGAKEPDQSWIEEKRELLRFMSVVQVDDGEGGSVPTIRFTGANVQIVNGLGATNGNPNDVISIDPVLTSTNGSGNLILGYNEDIIPILSGAPNPAPANRSGSHNLVGGIGASYSSYGGIALGWKNVSSAPFAAVLGGGDNEATGSFATVLGGGGFDQGTAQGNVASGQLSTIAGGGFNVASGQISHVCGGSQNNASVGSAVVVGGFQNASEADHSVVLGGRSNLASGAWSQVSGGVFNESAGLESSVSGGRSRTASGQSDWVGGSLTEDK